MYFLAENGEYIAPTKVAWGEGAKVLAFGKLQLLLLGLRLHFPSENRKSCPPDIISATPSKQSPGRCLFEAQKGIPHSAECGLP
jgi:hypothetical protein